MKNFTKTLVAATLTLSAVSANASIINDNTANAEAWLSVYDSTSANTFTLDLGAAAGLNWSTLFANQAAIGTLSTIDLSSYADWTAFKAAADLTTTKYVVAVASQIGTKKAFMLTGADHTFFDGKDSTGINEVNTNLNLHAAAINVDQALTVSPDTSLVNDLDGTAGRQAGSLSVWNSASYNPESAYGDLADFNLVTLVSANRKTSAVQEVFAAGFKLDGDALTVATPAVSAVPVPAAVWMFGSALLGLAGVSRKRKAV